MPTADEGHKKYTLLKHLEKEHFISSWIKKKKVTPLTSLGSLSDFLSGCSDCSICPAVLETVTLLWLVKFTPVWSRGHFHNYKAGWRGNSYVQDPLEQTISSDIYNDDSRPRRGACDTCCCYSSVLWLFFSSTNWLHIGEGSTVKILPLWSSCVVI